MPTPYAETAYADSLFADSTVLFTFELFAPPEVWLLGPFEADFLILFMRFPAILVRLEFLAGD